MHWDAEHLTRQEIDRYTAAVQETGSVKGVWGFVDGTLRPICRPSEDQRLWYSGYKKKHAFKFQGIMTPDGLISHLGGPFEGPVGDWATWHSSRVEDKLRALDEGIAEEDRAYLYGDPAYTAAYGIFGGYKAPAGGELPLALQAINTHMSSLRISVEHGFGKIVMHWGFNGHEKNLKMGLSSVASYYMVAVLLTNIHTCLHGSQTSTKFGCQPPSLHNYLYL
jgi:hypothetical protein